MSDPYEAFRDAIERKALKTVRDVRERNGVRAAVFIGGPWDGHTDTLAIHRAPELAIVRWCDECHREHVHNADGTDAPDSEVYRLQDRDAPELRYVIW